MSGTGPESLPTSADPRSKRPTKKRALSPTSAQASQLGALFSRPDQEVRLPSGSSVSTRRRQLPRPPEIVTNVQGSSAGAGSGEFHVYKAARRREMERLRQMDDELRAEEEKDDFAAKKKHLETRDEEKTRRNREKREKMKLRKEKARLLLQQKTDDDGGRLGVGAGGAIEPERGVEIESHKMVLDSQGSGEPAPAVASSTTVPGLVIHDD